ncbi:DUF1428 family protein [Halobacillus shinanisalinarum]|uniref:DUF1428 family protein n=1 Tax=Halobacillus shinanisalinarum TaxID=2932258 RepID=A0ABY4H5N4_9BACI|nr:DUF1428 family protein [Halobacillus shinanisalinarum]UOQ95753.1 DUF1428 family protein [Halobacillus shinanisalinarum]
MYIFRVKEDKADLFKQLSKKAKEIIRSYSGKATLYQGETLTGKQGSMGLLDLFELKDEEIVFFGKIEYPSKKMHTKSVEQMKKDDLITHLYEQIIEVVDMSHLVTSTFLKVEQ